METIRIEKLQPDEWQLYKQLRLEALLNEPAAFSSTYAETSQRPDAHWQQRLLEAQAGEKGWLLFARENGCLVGMIGAMHEPESDAVDIISVYVAREKRGQGVGAALMAAILAEVRSKNAFQKAALSVNADQAAAVALYRRFGFQVTAEITDLMGDGKIYRSYLMECPLVQPGD